MPTVIIDGHEIELAPDERLNGIQAASRAGIDIPRYCWHPGLSVVASCRMCLVETGRRDPQSGEISMVPKLVPACQTPATDGTVFVTNSDKVQQARAMVEEDLLIRHPVDCPICDKAGECYLQDYHFEHGRDQRRADIQPFTSRRRELGDTVTLFVDRCVMCSRCVRFCREVTGTSELMVINRGAHEEIDVFPGFPLENKLSGNVVDLCPVGALGDKDFLYKQRVWFMKRHEHVCGNCSTGCSIYVEENQDHVYRLKPRENLHINQWWMCDEGRYGWKYIHADDRLTQPARRRAEADGGGWELLDWTLLLGDLIPRLQSSARPAAVLSPFVTVEEAYLIGRYFQQLRPDAVLALGPIPTSGQDETFPMGFTIHAEKCPNRRGVEEVLRGLTGGVLPWDQFLEQVGDCDALWLAGGYIDSSWCRPEWAEALASIPLLIAQDLFDTPLSAVAHFRLPGAAVPEREGSFVNVDGRLQSFGWAVRPPSGVRTPGQLFWQLSHRAGLYRARTVMEEIAQELPMFAPASVAVPEAGVLLAEPAAAEAAATESQLADS